MKQNLSGKCSKLTMQLRLCYQRDLNFMGWGRGIVRTSNYSHDGHFLCTDLYKFTIIVVIYNNELQSITGMLTKF